MNCVEGKKREEKAKLEKVRNCVVNFGRIINLPLSFFSTSHFPIRPFHAFLNFGMDPKLKRNLSLPDIITCVYIVAQFTKTRSLAVTNDQNSPLFFSFLLLTSSSFVLLEHRQTIAVHGCSRAADAPDVLNHRWKLSSRSIKRENDRVLGGGVPCAFGAIHVLLSR